MAISAATSADTVGMYTSVDPGDDEGVPKAEAAIMPTEAGLLVTKVTAAVDVLGGTSFC